MICATSNIISIGNGAASLSVDLYGGGITGFHLLNGGVNPFTFKFAPENMPEHNRSGASYRGHFICLGRWGPPTAGEIRAGIPDHGEAANRLWEHITSIQKQLKMQLLTPLEGLQIKRVIEMDDHSAAFK